MNNQHFPINALIFSTGLLFPIFSIPTLPATAPPCNLAMPAAGFANAPSCTLTAQVIQPSNASEQLQRGEEIYQEQQFSEAIKVLEQAAQVFKKQGSDLNQALALNYLSLAYQKLGQWTDAKNAIAQSLQLLKTSSFRSNSQDYLSILAQAYNTKGQLQLAVGETEEALASWEQATKVYTKIGDKAGFIGSQINQAQALQLLGQYRLAKIMLTSVNETIEKQPDSLLKASSLLSLGNALRVTGDLDQKDSTVTKIYNLSSRQILEQSLKIAERLKSPETVAQIKLSLGNTFQALSNNAEAKSNQKVALDFLEKARICYEQAATSSASPMMKIQAKLNQLNLLVKNNKWSDAQALWTQLNSEFDQVSPSQATVYARINFVQSLIQLKQRTEAGEIEMKETNQEPLTVSSDLSKNPSWLEIAQLVATAVREAETLGSRRAEAYALATLGSVYEQKQQWKEAQKVTQQALIIAEDIKAPDIAYSLEWQLGRLLKAQGNITGAIAFYTEAVNNLKSIRSDLVAMNSDVQFSFRESVEPVYRELVGLLLQQEGDNKQIQKNLIAARQVIESLQLAEIDNFFRSACLNGNLKQIDGVVDSDGTAAVIYPIILKNRLEVILKLPKQKELIHYVIKVTQHDIESQSNQLRKYIVLPDGHYQFFIPSSQKLYDWLIKPALPKLSGVNTLVFVLDGVLRNIPMGALHDGKQYLIEKYSIALAPGLQLINPEALKRVKLKALLAGVSKPYFNFSELPKVKDELKEISSKVPSEVLLNSQFTSQTLTNRVEQLPFNVVHLATHGKFSSNAAETFIAAWDKYINVNDLNEILRTRNQNKPEALELLVLSACETAAGDNRAALGIAGVAVRAGARSTIASLWNVGDESTALLMSHLYQELANKSGTKAEALRQAQLTLLKNSKYELPLYWAPYVLVGNWL